MVGETTAQNPSLTVCPKGGIEKLEEAVEKSTQKRSAKTGDW
jgi:hypothetical protein